ncbi:ABC-type transport auxiliary lipoprotein family protein [Variovorax sp. AFSI2.2]|uniref:ABC-type transport auxiliary lipoprotein family protein n=1 Tax=Variovorax sp. AFSI2.2 TaxID=3384160 RepID=UPI003EC00A0E
MKNNATRTPALAAAGLALLMIAGCGALPDKPVRATLYDFGPGAAAPATAAQPPAAALPTLALAEIESNTRLDGTQILYRLGYADANELRPYGQSRWSLPPAQLLRQRLRDALAERRTVLGPEESATLARAEGKVPDTLRISLDEFSHYFESAGSSVGLVRLRATLIRGGSGGDRVVGQRTFTVRRPAPSADAPGGVKALAAATDAAVADVVQWVDQQARP